MRSSPYSWSLDVHGASPAVQDYPFDPGSNVVDVYVSYLRNRIDPREGSSFIQTVRGAGYRFDPSVGE